LSDVTSLQGKAIRFRTTSSDLSSTRSHVNLVGPAMALRDLQGIGVPTA
jgi:hypothetical protein